MPYQLTYAIDTETTGLDSFNGDKPFSIVTADQYDQTAYTDIYSKTYDEKYVQYFLRHKDIVKVFHNAKFDILMLEAINLEVTGEIHDTVVMAYIYNTTEPSYNLKKLAEKHLGIPNTEEQELKDYMRKLKITNYADVDPTLMEKYARKDALITMGLFKFYRGKGILEDATYIAEMKLLKCLLAMQRRGVPVDREFCLKEANTIELRLDEILEIVKREHDDINIQSPKELKEYLLVKNNLGVKGYTKKMNPSFDRVNLPKYDHPIIPLILEYRDLYKVRGTYLIPLYGKSSKGIVHCNFNQTGARTGRFSCSEPNLQNIPRSGKVDVRQAFICRKDFTNYYFDYSQIELRILAHYSKEQSMIDELHKPDGDLHALTSMGVFGEVTKEKRSLSKNINFGIIYGMGAKKFCAMVNQQYPEIDMNMTNASAYIRNYYKTYPAVKEFIRQISLRARKSDVGFVHDIFGRKYTCETGVEYKAVNYVIQGCAAGLIKRAMIDIDNLLSDSKSNMLLTIHDELVIEIHKDEEALVSQIKELMEDSDTFRVPITVSVEKTTTDWSEKSSVLS